MLHIELVTKSTFASHSVSDALTCASQESKYVAEYLTNSSRLVDINARINLMLMLVCSTSFLLLEKKEADDLHCPVITTDFINV